MSLSVNGPNTANLQSVSPQSQAASATQGQSDPLSSFMTALGQDNPAATSSPTSPTSPSISTSGTSITTAQFAPQTLQALLALQTDNSDPQSTRSQLTNAANAASPTAAPDDSAISQTAANPSGATTTSIPNNGSSIVSAPTAASGTAPVITPGTAGYPSLVGLSPEISTELANAGYDPASGLPLVSEEQFLAEPSTQQFLASSSNNSAQTQTETTNLATSTNNSAPAQTGTTNLAASTNDSAQAQTGTSYSIVPGTSGYPNLVGLSPEISTELANAGYTPASGLPLVSENEFLAELSTQLFLAQSTV